MITFTQKQSCISCINKEISPFKDKNKSSVQVWGTGKPKREFLHVDDLADGIFEVMRLSKEKYRKILEKI